jgi:hypothetical protein
MRIGIDFDNTIVSYDELFHRVAIERDLVPADTAPRKLAVRDYLRRIGREDDWTEMQGYVYGARMNEALAYPGLLDFLRAAAAHGHACVIVSHKTRNPFLGEPYDLHAAARDWIRGHLGVGDAALVAPNNVFFELTKDEKLARVEALRCDVFIDDLPEILQADGFPKATRRILFDPDGHHRREPLPDVMVAGSWHEIAGALIP